jgi:hypothetical protein
LPLGRLKTVVNSLRQLIRAAERHYESTHNGQSPRALEDFDAWFATHLENMKDRVQAFGQLWLPELNIAAITNVAVDNTIRQNLVTAYNNLQDIDTTGFFPALP